MSHYIFLYGYFFFLDLPPKIKVVKCQVCNEIRAYEKYARHLQLHVKRGQLSEEEMRIIIFQTKSTRNDVLHRYNHTQIGTIYSICGTHVLNINDHLLRQHGIGRNDISISNAIKTSKKCQRKRHFDSCQEVISNPSVESSNMKPISSELMSKNLNQSIPTNSATILSL